MPNDKKPSSLFRPGAGKLDADAGTEKPTQPAPTIKPVSKAPRPITPARGSAPSWLGRLPDVRPSWDEWAMMDAVTVYEAAALSLDLEPRRHGPNDRYSFPDDQTFNKFEMRCRIIEEGDWPALGRDEFRVSLPAFAAWAISKKMEIPAELRELAHAALGPEGTTPPKVPVSAKPSAHKGIPKRELLSVDWPLHGAFTQASLARAMSDVPNWLLDARVCQGAPGKASALWNPAVLADCLREKDYARRGVLCSLLEKHFHEWLPEFKERQDFE